MNESLNSVSPKSTKCRTVPRHGRPRSSSFPVRLNIQTQSGCNARCAFCPNTYMGETLKHGRMEWALFTRIVDECRDHPMERVNPFLMNEPLLDPRIDKCVRYIKDTLGDSVTTLLISNGSMLEPDLMKRLIDARLDRLKVSMQGWSAPVYESVMRGLDCDRAYANVEQASRIVRQSGDGRPKISVSIVVTGENEHEIRKFKRHWRRRGIKASASPVENRGGNITDMQRLAPSGQSRRVWCHRPFREACILFDGSMVLCCADWARRVVLGDVTQQSISDIWNGPRVAAIRRAIVDNDIDAMPDLCRSCTVSSLPIRQHLSFRGIAQRLQHWFRRKRRAGTKKK